MFPKKIKFVFDDSEMELVDVTTEIKRTKTGLKKMPITGLYRYTKGKYHVDDKIKDGLPVSELSLTIERVNKMELKQTIKSYYGDNK